eukprot:5504969-Pleurochrysis_carterae.AAC.1
MVGHVVSARMDKTVIGLLWAVLTNAGQGPYPLQVSGSQNNGRSNVTRQHTFEVLHTSPTIADVLPFHCADSPLAESMLVELAVTMTLWLQPLPQP